MERSALRKCCSIVSLFTAASIAGCGGGGGGGGGSLAAPIGAVYGRWIITEVSASASDPSCVGPLATYNAFITQNGNALTALIDGTPLFTGAISGGAVAVSGLNPDPPGNTAANVSGTIGATCNSLTAGVSSFSYSEPGFSCTGTVNFTGTRASGSGCAGTQVTTAVTEVGTTHNTTGTAQVFTMSSTVSGSVPAIANTTADRDANSDYYSFTLFAATPAIFMLTGPADQDIDLIVRDSVGTVIASSVLLQSREAIAFTSLAAGTYFVQVRPFTVNLATAYTLVVQ